MSDRDLLTWEHRERLRHLRGHRLLCDRRSVESVRQRSVECQRETAGTTLHPRRCKPRAAFQSR
jgi:hypothetical protein